MPRGYNLTMPEDDNLFAIKEEQLQTLVAGGRSTALDWGLFSLGVWVGFVPQTAEVVKALYNKMPITGLELAGLCLEIVFFVFSMLKLLEHRGRKADVSILEQKIRSGQKLRVG